jgi:hypothetical protein
MDAPVPTDAVGKASFFIADIPVSVKPGDTLVGFGGFDWQVLAVANGRATLITKEVVALRAYSDSGSDTTWEQCSLRAWLNNEFFADSFSPQEQVLVLDSQLANPASAEYGTAGGNDTTDKVYLLSIDEAQARFADNQERTAVLGMPQEQLDDTTGTLQQNSDYNSYTFSEPSQPMRDHNGMPLWWWLRSPGIKADAAATVLDNGTVHGYGSLVGISNYGVRPVVQIAVIEE